MQCLLLLTAIIQQVHTHAHIDTHALEGFGAGAPVDDVVAHVEAAFEAIEGAGGEELAEPFVRGFVDGGLVEVGLGVLVVVLRRGVGEVVEGCGACREVCVGDFLGWAGGGHGG